MYPKIQKRHILMLLFGAICICSLGQGNVPLGIHYQAVARNNSGAELANTKIDVRFSLIIGNPLGTVVYQELHQDVMTSKYGVFSLVIGRGIPITGGAMYGELSQINWGEAYHYIKVEVKFGNDFLDMGTMQFLAVPYALYALKSLEPGPPGPKGDQGPKGEPGDPASNTDNQNLSVVNIDGSDYLAISGGNQVKISNIEKDGDPTNELQSLSYNASTYTLSISSRNSVTLGSLVAFRAKKVTSQTNLMKATDYDFVADEVIYNNSSAYNPLTGIFTAPSNGIYNFNFGYSATGAGDSRELIIYLDDLPYEVLRTAISSGLSIAHSVTMKLETGNKVKVKFNTGMSTESGIGSFSGFRVN